MSEKKTEHYNDYYNLSGEDIDLLQDMTSKGPEIKEELRHRDSLEGWDDRSAYDMDGHRSKGW